MTDTFKKTVKYSDTGLRSGEQTVGIYIPNFCKLYRKKGTPYERNLHSVCTVVAYRLLFLRFLFQYPLERAYRPVI